MSTSMLRVSDSVKEKLEELKESPSAMRSKTPYEVIEKLIEYYERNEKNKIVQHQKVQEEKKHLELNSIHIGESNKNHLQELMNQFRFRSEKSVFEFLVTHYENSDSISKDTLNVMRGLIGS
jgi:predicted transcriptional regulator